MSYPPPPRPGDWQGQPDPAYGQQGPNPYGGFPHQGYGGGQSPYGPPTRTSGRATTSLVLGLLSLFCAGFLTGIPAIIVGMSARKEIRRSQGRLSGDGLALGGIISGILGTLLGLVVLLLFVGAFAFTGEMGEFVERSCEQLAQDNDPSNDCT